jgi:hypothetical protein
MTSPTPVVPLASWPWLYPNTHSHCAFGTLRQRSASRSFGRCLRHLDLIIITVNFGEKQNNTFLSSIFTTPKAQSTIQYQSTKYVSAVSSLYKCTCQVNQSSIGSVSPLSTSIYTTFVVFEPSSCSRKIAHTLSGCVQQDKAT